MLSLGRKGGTRQTKNEKEAKRKVFGRLLLIDNKESISPRDCYSADNSAIGRVSVR